MGSKEIIKDTITSNFKDKMWDAKEMEGKRKLRYYREVINPTLDNRNYLSIMNIARIRTKSHDLRSETEWGSTPKIL